jgi:hypothetical protein
MNNLLEHTPATALKSADDMAKAFQEVIKFHQKAIQQTKDKFEKKFGEATAAIDDARSSIAAGFMRLHDLEKEVNDKDDQSKVKDVKLEKYRMLHLAAVKDKQRVERELQELKDAGEVKRKGAWAAYEASKKVKM